MVYMLALVSNESLRNLFFLHHLAQSLIYVQVFQFDVNHIQNKCLNLAKQTLLKKKVSKYLWDTDNHGKFLKSINKINFYSSVIKIQRIRLDPCWEAT